jgi:hypothetical protein
MNEIILIGAVVWVAIAFCGIALASLAAGCWRRRQEDYQWKMVAAALVFFSAWLFAVVFFVGVLAPFYFLGGLTAALYDAVGVVSPFGGLVISLLAVYAFLWSPTENRQPQSRKL